MPDAEICQKIVGTWSANDFEGAPGLCSITFCPDGTMQFKRAGSPPTSAFWRAQSGWLVVTSEKGGLPAWSLGHWAISELDEHTLAFRRGWSTAGPPETFTRDGESSAAAPRPGRSPAPPAALRLADAYIESLAAPQREQAEHLRDDFIRSFFRGFVLPGATMTSGTEAGQSGFLAGQEYRRDHPEQVKAVMEGFGYTATEAEGVWTVFFEHSGFCPASQPAETWWLWDAVATKSDIPRDRQIPEGGLRIRVAGYLSPKGHFGHLGQYDHEFYPTSISRLGER